MIDPLPAKWSARSSLSAERFKRVLGLDSRPRTVAALLPRYAANAVSLLLGRVLLFGPIGGPPMAQPISMSQERAGFTAELSLRDAKINKS